MYHWPTFPIPLYPFLHPNYSRCSAFEYLLATILLHLLTSHTYSLKFPSHETVSTFILLSCHHLRISCRQFLCLIKISFSCDTIETSKTQWRWFKVQCRQLQVVVVPSLNAFCHYGTLPRGQTIWGRLFPPCYHTLVSFPWEYACDVFAYANNSRIYCT